MKAQAQVGLSAMTTLSASVLGTERTNWAGLMMSVVWVDRRRSAGRQNDANDS
jgi:hypothetical protein